MSGSSERFRWIMEVPKWWGCFDLQLHCKSYYNFLYECLLITLVVTMWADIECYLSFGAIIVTVWYLVVFNPRECSSYQKAEPHMLFRFFILCYGIRLPNKNVIAPDYVSAKLLIEMINKRSNRSAWPLLTNIFLLYCLLFKVY